MQAFVAGASGFLLAVLWFDLMFDIQVVPHRQGGLPEQVLASIASYYRRVTTDARPMNRLVAAVMVATVGGVVAESVGHHGPRWAVWASLLLVAAPVALAASRTVPSAVRLGGRSDALPKQATLARSILRDHLFCFASIACLLVLQLAAVR